MTPEHELQRFFKAFTEKDRKRVEAYTEYKKAMAADDYIAAMEIASIVLTTNLTWREEKRLFRKRFPDYAEGEA